MQVQVQEGSCQAVCDSLVDGQLGGACVQQDVRGQAGDTGQEEQEQGSCGEEGSRHGGWLGGSYVLGELGELACGIRGGASAECWH